MSVVSKHMELQQEIQDKYKFHIVRYKQIQVEKDILELKGITHAIPSWRRNKKGEKKYLYLIHPTESDGSRKREYIGCDPQRIQNALAAVDRLAQLQRLDTTSKKLRSKLSTANRYLIKFIEDAN